MTKPEPLDEKVLVLVERFKGKLPNEIILKVIEITSAGESALGLEILCDKLFDAQIPLSAENYLQIERLGKATGMAPNLWDFLKKNIVT